jgi:hypothetical protein
MGSVTDIGTVGLWRSAQLNFFLTQDSISRAPTLPPLLSQTGTGAEHSCERIHYPLCLPRYPVVLGWKQFYHYSWPRPVELLKLIDTHGAYGAVDSQKLHIRSSSLSIEYSNKGVPVQDHPRMIHGSIQMRGPITFTIATIAWCVFPTGSG